MDEAGRQQHRAAPPEEPLLPSDRADRSPHGPHHPTEPTTGGGRRHPRAPGHLTCRICTARIGATPGPRLAARPDRDRTTELSTTDLTATSQRSATLRGSRRAAALPAGCLLTPRPGTPRHHTHAPAVAPAPRASPDPSTSTDPSPTHRAAVRFLAELSAHHPPTIPPLLARADRPGTTPAHIPAPVPPTRHVARSSHAVPLTAFHKHGR
ncbi:hypothetical protein Acsp05_65970 [Actinokineospora sp. NBRC 105648]|nr:hypothetical protein Acsp05_65970 [Actinokineospora sp. NBRC 105648]